MVDNQVENQLNRHSERRNSSEDDSGSGQNDNIAQIVESTFSLRSQNIDESRKSYSKYLKLSFNKTKKLYEDFKKSQLEKQRQRDIFLSKSFNPQSNYS